MLGLLHWPHLLSSCNQLIAADLSCFGHGDKVVLLCMLLMQQHVGSYCIPFVPLGLDGGLWSIVNTNPTHDNRHQKCDCQHTEHTHVEGTQVITEYYFNVSSTTVRSYSFLWQQTVLLQLQF